MASCAEEPKPTARARYQPSSPDPYPLGTNLARMARKEVRAECKILHTSSAADVLAHGRLSNVRLGTASTVIGGDGTMREWLVIESAFKNSVFAPESAKIPHGYIPRDTAERLLGRFLGGTTWFTREDSEKMRAHHEWRETEPDGASSSASPREEN